VRARARAALHQASAADADFARALTLNPLPELYIERARLLAAFGPGGIAHALQALDDGIFRLGPIVTLELEAIDLEVGLGRYDAAIARVDHAAARTARKEEWLARRGAILERAGRRADAYTAYQAALTALSALPAWTQQTPASVALRTRLRNDVNRLATNLQPSKRDRQ
jgi:hypothetical protein